jgi:hypothetical protein
MRLVMLAARATGRGQICQEGREEVVSRGVRRKKCH